jgi:hypothetical protein
MTSLEPDEQQELRHACRRMLALAETMWMELEVTLIPPHIREQMFYDWWKWSLQPKFEMPDFSKLFKQDDS